MSRGIREIVMWNVVLLLQIVLLFYFRPTEQYVPYIYPLLLIGIPLKYSRVSLLFVAFFVGLFIDVFCNSFGVHAFSSVFFMYISPYVAGLFAGSYSDETKAVLPVCVGWSNYIFIMILLLLMYHLIVVILWEFSFVNLWENIQKGLISTLYALGISVIVVALFTPRKEDVDG